MTFKMRAVTAFWKFLLGKWHVRILCLLSLAFAIGKFFPRLVLPSWLPFATLVLALILAAYDIHSRKEKEIELLRAELSALKSRSPEHSNDVIPPALSVDFVFEKGLQKIKDQIEIFQHLDDKVGLILGFIVVSVAEFLGFFFLAVTENPKPVSYFSTLVEVLFFAGLFCVAVATLSGLMALWVRKVETGFQFSEMVARTNRPVEEIRLDLMDSLLRSCVHNGEVLLRKQRWVKAVAFFTFASVFCYLAVLAILFYKLVPQGSCHG